MDEMTQEATDPRDERLYNVLRLMLRSAELRLDHAHPLLSAGLTVPQFRVLFAAVSRGGVRAGVIAERSRMAPPNVTSVLDRLEERNLLRRLPDPDDGRATVVELTTEGRALVREIALAGRDELIQDLRHMSDEDVDALTRGLTAMVRAMEARRAASSN
jgi:DNA-binding MarR family transcriptional regulator